MAVGKAFERLKAGSAGRTGTRPAVVLLLLQARPLDRPSLQLLPALSAPCTAGHRHMHILNASNHGRPLLVY